jgi:malate permease and related proteins
MENLVLIGICLLLGIVFQRIKDFPSDAHLSLNSFIIYVSLPAITLLYVPQLPFSPSLWMPVSTAWLVFIAAAIFFKIMQGILHFDKRTLGCLILTCGLFNSSFIGFPVIKALYGEVGLQMAIMVDQPGSFVVLSTLGITTAAWFSTGNPEWKLIARKIFSFPPLWGFAIAFTMRIMQWHHAEPVENILKTLANTMTPLALISVGLQLKWNREGIFLKELFGGLFYKLLLAPAMIFLLFIMLFQSKDLAAQVSVLEAAMAPMITGAILAAKYELNPRLANMLVGVGIPLSFITLALWYFLLKSIL